jgi:cell division septum initiation protein DivIVA
VATQGLKVRVSAEIAQFARDMNRATQDVDRLARQVNGMGQTFTRSGAMANQAAASLSNLSRIIPATSASFASLAKTTSISVGVLGTAGLVMGETAVISAGLTKTWGLLSAASLRLTAIGVPAWLGAIASPAGLAVAGVAALGAAVYGLKKAFDAVTEPGRRAQRVLDDYKTSVSKIRDADVLREQTRRLQQDFDRISTALQAERQKTASRRSFFMAGAAGPVTLGGGGDPAVIGRLEQQQKLVANQMFAVGQRLGEVLPTAAEKAADAWKKFQERIETVATATKQAVAGLRPITDTIGEDWGKALSAVELKLKSTVGLSAQQVNQLVAMRAALRDIVAVSGPLTRSQANRLINTGGLLPREKMFGHGLDPRTMLGARMGATPTSLGLDVSILKEQTQVFREGWMQVRSAIVDQLPLRLSMLISGRTAAGAFGGAVGGAFGSGAAAALVQRFFHQPIKDDKGKVIGSKLGEGVGAQLGSAVIPILGSVAGAFLGSKIGDFFGGLFGGRRRHHEIDRTTAAFAKLASQTERLTTTISNIPTGFKVAGYIDAAADPEHGTVAPRMRRGMYVFQIGNLHIRADNPDDFAEQMSKAAEKAVRRGGVSGFQLAVAQTARGF